MRDWIERAGDVENNDPDQTSDEGGDHQRCQPGWALLGSLIKMGELVWNVDGILLAAL